MIEERRGRSAERSDAKSPSDVEYSASGMSEKSHETLVIRNRMAELARVEQWLADIVEQRDMAPETAFGVDLVINEAVANIISYAYRDDDSHEISLSLAETADAVVIEIVDGGIPFNPFDAPAMTTAPDLEQATIGGRGIHLIKSFADDYAYSRVTGHNHLKLAIHKKGVS
jgi:anti-sigma regulatory factor (Ser/Thr protein kinase)